MGSGRAQDRLLGGWLAPGTGQRARPACEAPESLGQVKFGQLTWEICHFSPANRPAIQTILTVCWGSQGGDKQDFDLAWPLMTPPRYSVHPLWSFCTVATQPTPVPDHDVAPDHRLVAWDEADAQRAPA